MEKAEKRKRYASKFIENVQRSLFFCSEIDMKIVQQLKKKQTVSYSYNFINQWFSSCIDSYPSFRLLSIPIIPFLLPLKKSTSRFEIMLKLVKILIFNCDLK